MAILLGILVGAPVAVLAYCGLDRLLGRAVHR